MIGRQARLIAGSVFDVLITSYVYRCQTINVLFQTVVVDAMVVDWNLTYNMKDKVEKWKSPFKLGQKDMQVEMKKSTSKYNFAYQKKYVVSLLWHGFYIDYYFSFFQWAIMNNVNKAIFRVSCNTNYLKIFETNPLAKNIRWYVANTVFNVFGITFFIIECGSNSKILQQYQVCSSHFVKWPISFLLSHQFRLEEQEVKRMKVYILQKSINVKQLFGYLFLFHKDKQIKFNLQVKYIKYLLIFIEIGRFILVLRQYQVKTMQQFQMTILLFFDLYYSIEFELVFLKLDVTHREHKASLLYHEKMELQEEGIKQRCHSLCISVFKYGSPQLIQQNNEILM